MHRELACTALALSALAGTADCGAADARTGDYPTKPIRLVNPFAPGGTTDLAARLVAQRLTEALGQQVIVDNRPGAATTIGTEIVARAQPDGYTLLCTTTAVVTTPSFYPKLGFHPVRDLAPVTRLGFTPNVLGVHPSTPIRTVRDLVDLARAKPGQFSIAHSGTGSTSHLALELLKSQAGIDITHVPYKGGGPAVTDAVGGQVTGIFNSPAVVVPHVRSGRLRGLAVTSARRSEVAPELPPLGEAAGLPDYEVIIWYALFAPAATPPNVVARLNAAMNRFLESPQGRERMLGIGLEAAGGTPEAFGQYVRTELERWTRLIKAAGVASVQ